jgi:hypothetical protein
LVEHGVQKPPEIPGN